MPIRTDAWNLLCQWTQSDSLRKHALAVEAAMRGAARRQGGDEELWGITGLLHDFDYERYPTLPDHPTKGAEVLRETGYPPEMIDAVLGHASMVPRTTLMAKWLYAVDELCGFLLAVAYVRPSRKIAEVEVSSVKKKLKDKAFARAVNREDIRQGAAELGVESESLIAQVLEDLKGSAEALGV